MAPLKGSMRATKRSTGAIRAVINLAIQSRRRRNSFPPESSTSIRADEAYRSHILAAKIMAIHLL